ncbi:hypothetical protein [Methylobacterium brachythecii]|uniref:Uncharacterized protein n=1 Tax=Methylobacterium brachythecii TaxID=1176177 RepID=A0A7W6AKI2_9HYPH|nr:hypothetical protein [Methylobacterium brachythecii]MBB3905095.1 hypothetical protein [Methylobacterium brachythecii]GLS44397.1 hypothetical protein GCM10007884_23850 [Methylobacterium brachythecii]
MRRVSLASLNPLRAIGRWAAHYSIALVHDSLRGVGSAIHASEARTQGELRSFEERQSKRVGAILSELTELRREQDELRALHSFVGDPRAPSPAMSIPAGDRLVPRHAPARDPRLPAGRPHP